MQLVLAVAMCTFGCALLIAGICIPPAGVIDASVLVAFGEILTFAGSLLGIDYHYKYKKTSSPPSKEKGSGKPVSPLGQIKK